MPSFQEFIEKYCAPDSTPVAIDYSRMGFGVEFLERMEPEMQRAYEAMTDLEKGAIANPDEKRMVGHYWLRNFDLIPNEELRADVMEVDSDVRRLIADVFSGRISAPGGQPFHNLLCIGIGGSALGPQFICETLDSDPETLRPYFLDNTDPEGIQRVLEEIGYAGMAATLVVVISKSGGTPETRNGMMLTEAAFEKAGLEFCKYAVAITGRESKLDHYAKECGWIARIPMFDWVGGRTSVMSAVGLLPCGLAGLDLDEFLAGAAAMDAVTRNRNTKENPAALLALSWYHATNGKGEKDMVVIPYKDSLMLFSKYLQQLIMESLGKERDLDGHIAEQGIAVYGNKGSTDQHAYVQQLREGVANFFVVFIEALIDGGNSSLEVEEGVTAGDYLSGFYQGTREALTEKDRPNLSLTIDKVSPESLGALIALFERAVGFYATLVNINAYHQPGVEAGKKAAAAILEIQKRLLGAVQGKEESKLTAEQWAQVAGCEPEQAFKILQHLAYNHRGVVMEGRRPDSALFSKASDSGE